MGAGTWEDSQEKDGKGSSPWQGPGGGEGRKVPDQSSQSIVLTIMNLGELNTKSVLGAKESPGMTSLLESEMMQVTQLPKDKEIQEAGSKRMVKAPRWRKGQAAEDHLRWLAQLCSQEREAG